MDSARVATTSEGNLAYSIFQQGAGVVNAADALTSTASDCANQGVNINKDLSGESHYYGPANIDADGSFFIEGLGEEYRWNISKSLDGSGFIWTNLSNR